MDREPVTDVRDNREISIFVSQPMHGKKLSEIFEVIEYAEAELSEEYPNRRIAVMYEYILDNNRACIRDCISPLGCFAHSLEAMDYADVVVFAPGWSEARGCILEHSVAEKYGKKILYMKGAETNESVGC